VHGKALDSRSWVLIEDRSKFLEEGIEFVDMKSKIGTGSANS
jgi:hypothetical protein